MSPKSPCRKTPVDSPTPVTSPNLEGRTVLGRYLLQRELGRGGMGCVYRAWDQTQNQPAAVKVLQSSHRAGTFTQSIARFRREAMLLSEMKHQNIVRFLEHGAEGNGYFIAMELVEGVSLRQILQRRMRFDVKNFLDLAIQLAEVVGYTQSHGVVHRDLKPQNIMVTQSLGLSLIKVLDFGLGVLSNEGEDCNAEGIGHVMGTVAYASPEQTGLLERPVDARADLYSLGVIFYEMLTGKVPFEGSDPDLVLLQHMSRIPSKIHEVVPEIPPVLSDIVARLLEKEPDERYQTGRGLFHDLMECRKNLTENGQIPWFHLGTHDWFRELSFGNRLVGRKRPLESLKKSMSLVQSGTCHAVSIQGELGIGKSYLVSEFRSFVLRQKGTFFTARLQRMSHDCGLRPVIQVAEDWLRRWRRMSAQRRAEMAVALQPVLETHGKVLCLSCPGMEDLCAAWAQETRQKWTPVVREGELGESEPAAEEQHRAYHNFFAAASFAEEALVLHFDDVHWGDDELFNFLSQLMVFGSSRNARLLLVFTWSKEDEEGAHRCQNLIGSWRRDGVFVHSHALECLTEAEVHAFISDAAKGSPEDILHLSKAVYLYTHGNPLFIREMLKTMVASEFLHFDPGQRCWVLKNRDLEGLKLPTNVVDLVITRARDLGTEDLLVLCTAARMGGDFSLETLRQLHPELEGKVESIVNKAVSQHLVAHRGGVFYFSNSKIRDHFLSDEVCPDVEEVHRRILEWLTAHPPANAADYIRLYARHSLIGLQRMRPDLVVGALFRAGKMDGLLGDLTSSREMLNKALELALKPETGASQQEIAAIKLELAGIYMRSRESAKARALLNACIERRAHDQNWSETSEFFVTMERMGRIQLWSGEEAPSTSWFPLACDASRKFLTAWVPEKKKRFASGMGIGEKLKGLLNRSSRQNPTKDDKEQAMGGPAEQPNITPISAEHEESLDVPVSLFGAGIPDEFFDELRIPAQIHLLTLEILRLHTPEDCALFIDVWKNHPKAFRNCSLDLFWLVWSEELLRSNDITQLMSTIQEIFETMARQSLPDTPAAVVYRDACRLLWEAMSLGLTESQSELLVFQRHLDFAQMRSCHQAVAIGYVLKANLRFLRGDWDEIQRCLEQAQLEADGFGYPGLLAEVHAWMAVLLALRDADKAQRHLEKSLLCASTSRSTRMLQLMAENLMLAAGNPYDVGLAKVVTTGMSGLWLRLWPGAVVAQFIGFSCLLSGYVEGKFNLGSSRREASHFQEDLDRLFPDKSEKGITGCMRALLQTGIDALFGMGSNMQALHQAEVHSQRLDIPFWHTVERLQLHRFRQREAVVRQSLSLTDEAQMHLSQAGNWASEAGFNRLSESLFRLCNRSGAHAHSVSPHSRRTHMGEISTILRKLKVDQVFSLSQNILTLTEEEKILSVTCEGLVDICAAERGAIFLREKQSNHYVYRASFGFNVEPVTPQESMTHTESGNDMPLSWAVITRVRKEGRAVLIDNAQMEEGIANQFAVAQGRIRSVMGIPIMLKEHMMGIIYLDSSSSTSLFTRETLKLAEPVVTLLGIAMTNQWLQKSSRDAYLALKQSHENLMQSEKLAGIGEIAASVAHDINTPLSTVLGYTEDIEEQIADLRGTCGSIEGSSEICEDVIKSLGRMRSACQKMQKLVVSMRDFSRKSGSDFAATSLVVTLEETLILTEKKFQRLGVKVSLSFPPKLPAIWGNANQLEQLFMNLMNNAADAMENSATKAIVITASPCTDGALEVRVSDTGCGMPEEVRKKIFQSFFTTKPKGKGTGLGLAVVRSVVVNHQGGITVESTPHSGTTFVLKFPTVDDAGLVKGTQPNPFEGEGGVEQDLMLGIDDPMEMAQGWAVKKAG